LTIAEYLMPPWLLALRRSHPEAEVTARVANSHRVCESVRAGEVDLGFIEAPDVPAGFGTSRVGTDRLVLVASPELVQELGIDEIDPDRLRALPLLLREHGSGTRDTFLQALAETLGDEPKLSHATELGSTTTILATARAGGGIGVVSSRAVAGELAGRALREIRVHGLRPERPLTALWMGSRPPGLARELLTLAQGCP
jgi:DNA-binding transcriptional LysR family regulator